MKIIVALLVLISLGIVVGSNLFSTITVVILNQPTIALPIGIWLLIAIGLGLLSSLLIQLLILLDRQRLKRQIRQLQSRLQQQDEDIFTYTSSKTGSDDSSRDRSFDPDRDDRPSSTKTSPFKSYRSNLDSEDFPPHTADSSGNRSSTRSTKSIVDDDLDDWDVEPSVNRQLDWDDAPQQNFQSPSNKSTTESKSPFEQLRQRIYPEDRSSQTIENAPKPTSREVYDADFRLIQPPYKQPLETEFDDELTESDFEDPEIDENDDRSTSSVTPTPPKRSSPSSNLEDEDWGFDFDDRDTPAKAN
jgi:hypothetical protein